jgi:hypothetical protein
VSVVASPAVSARVEVSNDGHAGVSSPVVDVTAKLTI